MRSSSGTRDTGIRARMLRAGRWARGRVEEVATQAVLASDEDADITGAELGSTAVYSRT